MEDIKDSIANGTTVAAAGAAMLDWTSILTIVLVITGIILNVARIIEIRRRSNKDSSSELVWYPYNLIFRDWTSIVCSFTVFVSNFLDKLCSIFQKRH